MASEQADNGAGERKSGYWKPAIRMALAAIAVLIILLIFRIFMILAGFLMKNEGWMFRDMFGEYPVYNALFDIAMGIMLLIVAGFFVGGKSWKEALFDRLRLAPDGRNARLLVIGLIIGLIAAVGTNLMLSMMDLFLYGGHFYVQLYEDMLATGLVSMLPRLVMYVGLMALLLGYFQRRLTDRYGTAAGLLGVTLLYLQFTIFPSNMGMLAVPEISARYVLTGVVIGYLYLVTKSPYPSIGLMVAWNSFWDIYNSVFHTIPSFGGQIVPGDSRIYVVAYTLIIAQVFTLVLIWYLYSSPWKMTGDRLKGLGNALYQFFSRLTGS
jgi:hypothetical protein